MIKAYLFGTVLVGCSFFVVPLFSMKSEIDPLLDSRKDVELAHSDDGSDDGFNIDTFNINGREDELDCCENCLIARNKSSCCCFRSEAGELRPYVKCLASNGDCFSCYFCCASSRSTQAESFCCMRSEVGKVRPHIKCAVYVAWVSTILCLLGSAWKDKIGL